MDQHSANSVGEASGRVVGSAGHMGSVHERALTVLRGHRYSRPRASAHTRSGQ